MRDGHYPIWGPLHLLYKVNAKGEPENATIRGTLLDIVGYLSGSKALPNGVSLIDVYAQSGLVPECAMPVSRDCEPCKVQGDCSAGQTCSRGYCEEQ